MDGEFDAAGEVGEGGERMKIGIWERWLEALR